MSNTLETLRTVLKMLSVSGVQCDVFGGWAEEILGLREPWQHSDIDLVYRGSDFSQVDAAIKHRNREFFEVEAKRFRHKRAFMFRETLCEIVLVQDSETRPVTYYWGDVPFEWLQPFLHFESVELGGDPATVVSSANLRRYRDLWRRTQPHRWKNPDSLEHPG